jgi:hypothetical protein
MLLSMLALILWTFIIETWMYATRIPAMHAAGIRPGRIKRAEQLEGLPVAVKQIADNYNHLHEQPQVFYALAICAYLVHAGDPFTVALAWIYVAIRVVHSLIQCTSNFVPLRFFVFVLSSVVLVVLAIRDVFAVTGQ